MRTAAKSAVAAASALVVLALAFSLFGLPSFLGNPFQDETVVRDHAALLESLEDISEYHAATGSYQVVVDIEHKTRYVPGFLKGERTTFLAQGSVDAYVDLGALDDASVIVGDDGAVTVILPPAELDEPVVDHEASGVLDRDRGLVDRVGGLFSDQPTSDRELYLEAERRLAAAAAEDDALRTTAQENTEAMVRELLAAAGIDEVRVIFSATPGGVS